MPDDRVEQFRKHYAQGLKLLELGKDEAAMDQMWLAAKAAPEGWLQLALELIKDGRHELALERLREVLKLTKNTRTRAAALNNIGLILANRGQNDAALEAFTITSMEEPGFSDTWSNLALLHKWAGDYKTAIRYATRALKIDPWHEQAGFIRSMALLLDGDLINGFKEYEIRWRSKTNGLRKIESPALEWNGEGNVRLLIYGEQGHGDSILMLRYARELKRMGIWQAWVAQKSMAPLLRSMPEIDLVLEPGEALPEFDMHIPSVSIPRVLAQRTDTLSGSPYIPRIQREGQSDQITIGIAWRGSQAQANDLFRSTSLSDWEPVLSLPGIRFVSLQVDNSDEGLLYPTLEQAERPKDWMDTVKAVSQLDLVISVDTSIVHLCGALGVEVWCALHCRPYFVYPPAFGDRTPWYDSVRLFRQKKERDWKPVFQSIREQLIQKYAINIY